MSDRLSPVTASVLEGAVWLRVAELRTRGGPPGSEYARCREVLADRIASGSDVLFGRHPNQKQGQFAATFRDLVEALAVAAFCPGGVTLFGLHFDVTETPCPPTT